MLARQVWRLLQDPESLSARVLRARYYPHGSVLEATIGAHPTTGVALANGRKRNLGVGTDQENWLWFEYAHMGRQLASAGLQAETGMFYIC